MGERRKAREAALSYLYQMGHVSDAATLSFERFLKHFKVSEPSHAYFRTLVDGVQTNQKQIDQTIEAAAENWRLSRMNKLDLSLLRLATYEILFCRETDFQVFVDEAIELAKIFASTETAQFINGILDRIAKERSA